jgi:glutathione S-transferase
VEVCLKAAPLLTCLTFAPMIDSECVRLILRHHGIAHRERDRIFGWASVLAVLRGGTGQVPFIYGGGMRVSGPRALADAIDARHPVRRLIPVEAGANAQVGSDWTFFNEGLGTAVAVFAYHHLLPERAAMIRCFGQPVTASGRAILPAVYPALAGLFRWALTLTPDNMNASRKKIGLALDQTDARIADGRNFLNGDMITLSDLALASAIAPLILPPVYAAQLPALEVMPAAMRALVSETRMRPVAALIHRIYTTVGANAAA